MKEAPILFLNAKFLIQRTSSVAAATAALLLLFLLPQLLPQQSFAQMNKTKEWQLGVSYGPLMSGSAPGFTEATPGLGLKLNKGMSYYRPLIYILKGESTADPNNTIDATIYGLSLKNILNFDIFNDVSELSPYLLTGLQYIEYESSDEGNISANGFHLGGGIDYHLVSKFYLSGELILHNGPWRVFAIHVGLQYHFGGNPTQ